MVAMNAQLDDHTYDRPLFKIIHFNATSMKRNFELLPALSLLFKNSWLVNNTVTEAWNQRRMNRPVSQRSSLVHIRNTKYQNGHST